MSWPIVALGNCTKSCKTWNPQNDDPHGSFNYIDLSSVNKDTKSVEDVPSVPCSDAPSRARQIVETSDVLVSTVRPNLNGVALVPEQLHGATASTGFTVLRPITSRIDPAYLFHWVKNPSFVDDMVRHATGASYPAVSDKIVREAKLPLPPLPEQRRIAAILDKADALRAKRREAITKLDQLLQSVFIDMFGEPASNPRKMKLARLSELGEWKSGGTPSRKNSSYFDGDIPWYSSGELNDVYIKDSAERISQNALRDSNAKIMRPETLMIGMYDTAAFKSSITTVPSACNQAIAYSLLDREKVETLYVYYALQIGKEHYKRLQRGVRQKNLNLSMVRATEVPFPALDLQKRFARTAERLHRQKKELQHHAAQLDTLFTSLQHRAFAGEL